jgi:CBS domain containing-hemolysin-like protein
VTSATTIWLIVVSLLTTCLAAIAAKALREFSRQKLEVLCRRHGDRRLLGEILLRYDRVALAADTLQVLGTALAVCASTYWLWDRSMAEDPAARPGAATIWSAAALGGLLLMAAEIWLPQAVANLWSEGFIFYTWRVWRVISLLLAPLVGAATFVDAVLHRLAGRTREQSTEESFEEEIRTIVSEGHREGLLEEDAREMIEGVMQLNDVVVSEIMTPRTDVIAMSISTGLPEAAQFIAGAAHSRMPVYNKTRDDIIGILHAKDLLAELAKPNPAERLTIQKILREPYFVPESKRVDELLREFQLTRNHMAIVLDEYGGVSGLVTIEDVLEEIVGEIVDEYDEEVVQGIRRIDQHTAEALARVHIDEINEQLGLALPEDGDFDTIGGFVFHELGRVPAVGEQVTWQNVRLTVLEATRRRIDRLRIDVLDTAQRESA